MSHNKQSLLNLLKTREEKKMTHCNENWGHYTGTNTDISHQGRRDRSNHPWTEEQYKEEYTILTSEATLSKQTSPQWRLRSVFFVSVLFTSLNPKKLTEPRVICHVASGSEDTVWSCNSGFSCALPDDILKVLDRNQSLLQTFKVWYHWTSVEDVTHMLFIDKADIYTSMKSV